MLEKWISVKAQDGKDIHVLVNQADREKSERCLVIVHGLCGRPYEYMFQVAARYFVRRGYDVYRIALYGDRPNARTLENSRLALNATDINDVMATLRPQYRLIYTAGHSYGGLAMLVANPNCNGLVFWDSVYVPTFLENEAQYVPALDAFKLNWDATYLLGKDMVEEARLYTRTHTRWLSRQITKPVLITMAENGINPEDQRALFDDLECHKFSLRIPDAGHEFTEGSTAEQLASATHDFFSKLELDLAPEDHNA